MNRFAQYILEEKIREVSDSEPVRTDDTKRAMVNQIASYLNRFVASPKEGDVKSMLLLIAALSVLNTTETDQSIQTAKRLAQLAFNRSSRGKRP